MVRIPTRGQLLWAAFFAFVAGSVGAVWFSPAVPVLAAKAPSFVEILPGAETPQPRAVLLPRAVELSEAPEVVEEVITPIAPSEPSLPKPPEKRTSRITADDIEALMSQDILLPLPDLDPETLRNTFHSPRSGGRVHKAIDIYAPKGTPIYAITDGVIVRKFVDDLGGICLYQKDATGQFMFFYAHLWKYAKDLKDGQPVKKGDIIAYVGATGNAKGGPPHLHFAISKLLNEKAWWNKLSLVNPYFIFTKKPYPLPAPRPKKSHSKPKSAAKSKPQPTQK